MRHNLKVTILTVESYLGKGEFNALLPLVSVTKQDRISRFRFVEDAQNTLLGDVLARVELCAITGLDNNQLIFSVNEYGKPFLTNVANVHYNISHSGRYIVCALSSSPVGVDVELIKPIDLRIAKRFFTQEESEYIVEPEDGNEFERFFQVWTMKESYIKKGGMGLSKPLRSFSVFNTLTDNPHYYHLVYKNNEAISYICTSISEVPVVKITSITDLLEEISHMCHT